MLKIRNIEKINGKQITDKWEVYEAIEAPTEYQFVLTNVGHYKSTQWYVTLDRFKDEVMDRYRIRTNRNGKLYEYLITTNSINPTELIYYINSIIVNVKKDEDANNTKL
jgi:hypothetical protein